MIMVTRPDFLVAKEKNVSCIVNVTVNGKTYTNALPFNGKFRLVSVYHPFKTVHAKRLNG